MKFFKIIVIFILTISSLNSNEKEHELLMATLFVQSSAEFYANSKSIYKAAENNLKELLQNKYHTAALEQTDNYHNKPPAIILDVDQTVLDNSAYQARLIKNNTSYPDGWVSWAKEEKAEFLPGALEFLQFALSEGVEIFFVTNRVKEIEEATIKNYQKLGLNLPNKKDFILSRGENNWGSNKSSRRELLARDYRIVMMFGDNLGDFVDIKENNLSPAERISVTKKYNDYWGVSWYMFSNPMYGDWEGSIIDFDYSISRDKKLEKKSKSLDQK
ncbi:MAG: HAD family acid phosphatase [Pseudomonadota bacterium]|nr:HAD family acid phosphatase [Pseudomonadota bacterium]